MSKDPLLYKFLIYGIHPELLIKSIFFPKNIQTSMHLERNLFVPEIATKKVSMKLDRHGLNDSGPITNSEPMTNSEPVSNFEPMACPKTDGINLSKSTDG